MPGAAIDTSDIPEVTDWTGARRGVFYRPIKQQLTLRLDADVVAWFKRQGGGYQTRINRALREYAGKAQRKREANSTSDPRATGPHPARGSAPGAGPLPGDGAHPITKFCGRTRLQPEAGSCDLFGKPGRKP